MPYLTVEGRKAHYVHRQPASLGGPPVLFIHGAGGSHQHWLYQVRDLPGVPTYAIDLPGHGRSEGWGRASIPAYSDWSLAFLDAAGLDRAVLVGHSMGGAIALDLALRHRQRVAGLGLVATGARLRVAPAVFDAIREDPEGAVRLICGAVFAQETPPEIVQLASRQMATIPAGVLHGDFVACDQFDVMDRLGEIAVPTVVVCGTQDQMTPVKYATYLRNSISGATLHLVDGAGHMVMIEQPGSVVQALCRFLGSLCGSPPGCAPGWRGQPGQLGLGG